MSPEIERRGVNPSGHLPIENNNFHEAKVSEKIVPYRIPRVTPKTSASFEENTSFHHDGTRQSTL